MPTTNQTALEQTFSDLAYSHLRDKSQQLLDYLVGFQMLKTEDDGKRAVGIFGFEIDEDYYYSPVFFLNGEIHGPDSIYSVKSDLFIPITDDWINTIINRRQLELGDVDRRSREERGVRTPNYSKLKIIPGGSGNINLKLGSSETVLDAMMGEREQLPDLPAAMRAAGVAGQFKQAMLDNSRLRSKVEQFHSLFDFYDEAQTKVAAQEEPVTVITSITDAATGSLTDEQRKELLEDGVTVIDNRPEVDKSMVYKSETKDVLENPTGGALYDMLCGDGTVKLALISPTGTGDNHVIVHIPSEDMHGCLPGRYVNVVRKYNRQETIDWLKSNGVTPSEVTPGSVGFFMSTDCEGTAPFCLSEKRGGLDNITCIKVHDKYRCDVRGGANYGMYDAFSPSSGYRSPFDGGNASGPNNGNANQNMFDSNNRQNLHPQDQVQEVVIAEFGSPKVIYNGKQLLVNDKSFYFVPLTKMELRKPKDDDDNESFYQGEKYRSPAYDRILKCDDFGNYNTIRAAIEKSASALKIWKTASDITIDGDLGQFSSHRPTEVMKHLVVKHAFDLEDAKVVVAAAQRQPTVFKVKYAAELLQLPDIDDTGTGGQMNMEVPEQIPYSTKQVAQSPDNRDIYRYFSPFGAGGGEGAGGDPGAGTFDIVDEAAETGQKEVFDAAALASLIKTHNPTDMIDKFIPTMTAGMDRLGRMLFLIYWHYNDFEERYGDRDLAEFIDNIKSVFEQLGDIIVFAKKRTLAGDPEHYGVGMTPGMEA